MMRLELESEARSFLHRFMQEAEEAEEKARTLKPGLERDDLLRRLDIAHHIAQWISSPGLRAPK